MHKRRVTSRHPSHVCSQCSQLIASSMLPPPLCMLGSQAGKSCTLLRTSSCPVPGVVPKVSASPQRYRLQDSRIQPLPSQWRSFAPKNTQVQVAMGRLVARMPLLRGALRRLAARAPLVRGASCRLVARTPLVRGALRRLVARTPLLRVAIGRLVARMPLVRGEMRMHPSS